MRYLSTVFATLVSSLLSESTLSFSARLPRRTFTRRRHVVDSRSALRTRLLSSFAADGSEYSSMDKKGDIDDDMDRAREYQRSYQDEQEEDEGATIELQPVPLSKNAGNRFVAIIWDRELDTEGRDALDLHHDRIQLTEDHVMFCRKANLYNETFNTESMVDVLWSLPMYVNTNERDRAFLPFNIYGKNTDYLTFSPI
jgi:hypothetical protein